MRERTVCGRGGQRYGRMEGVGGRTNTCTCIVHIPAYIVTDLMFMVELDCYYNSVSKQETSLKLIFSSSYLYAEGMP